MPTAICEHTYVEPISSKSNLNSFKTRLSWILYPILIGIAEDSIPHHPIGAETKIGKIVVLVILQPDRHAKGTIREDDVSAGGRGARIDIQNIKSLGQVSKCVFAVGVRESR